MEVHNSRRPLDRLTLKVGFHYPSWRFELMGVKKMHPSSGAINSARELGLWTRVVETDLNPKLDPIFIGGRGIVMDYLCAKFGNFSFSRFGFIMRTDRITEADLCYTHLTTVSVSN